MVEAGRAGEVFANPAEDYTKQLLAAVPSLRGRGPAREASGGDPLLLGWDGVPPDAAGLYCAHRRRTDPGEKRCAETS